MFGEVGLNGLLLVAGVAGVAGFVTGLAGFGTGLVAIGLWLHALPAPLVPPLVVVSSVAGQLVSLVAVRRAISWRPLFPYLAGASMGVPVGVLALRHASPDVLRVAVGLLLVAFAAFELVRRVPRETGTIDGHHADALIGACGGFLGGFAGLSGPLPIVWLRLRDGSPDSQRAIYQPFNLFVLSTAAVVMGIEGRLGGTVLVLAAFCFPATLLGASLGVRCYRLIQPSTFRRVVLGLLCVSGVSLMLGR